MEVGSSSLPGTTTSPTRQCGPKAVSEDCPGLHADGGLAQLARAPALQAGGQRFESVILHCSEVFTFEPFFDILTQSRQIEYKTLRNACLHAYGMIWHCTAESMGYCPRPQGLRGIGEKANKGAWRMPWLTEAMKDVISCDKPRLGANTR